MKTIIQKTATTLLLPLMMQFTAKAGEIGSKPATIINSSQTLSPDKPVFENPDPTGIADLTVNNKTFVIFPVPAKETVSVKVNMNHRSEYQLVVYDVVGKEIKRVSCESEITQFNELKSGMYFMTLQENGKTAYTSKFIIN